MTTRSRWYILAREFADGQSDYVFVGTTDDKQEATRLIDAEPEAREALKLRASSRQQAVDWLPKVYDGRKVKGYLTRAEKRLASAPGRAIVKAAVMRQIFCPYTGVVLDMRRAVVIDTTTRMFVMEATHWDEVKDAVTSAMSEKGREVTVYDGRELFK